MSQKLDGCSGAQVGAADTDDQQYIRIRLDLRCCLFDAGKLILIIVHWKIDPSKEIIACTCL